MGQGFFTTSLGRRWTFSLYGGAYITQVQGLQQVALDPVIAALLGQGTAIQAFYKESVFPTGSVALRANFRTSNVTLSYSRSVTPGNGVYLTSRVESADLSYSYTGLRKWNFQVNGGYNTLNTVGQGLEPYAQYAGGAGITYGLTRSLHVIARYDARQQSIDQYFYRRTSYRATLGLAYSPGDKPLSLW
jgi:hypothetical protein